MYSSLLDKNSCMWLPYLGSHDINSTVLNNRIRAHFIISIVDTTCVHPHHRGFIELLLSAHTHAQSHVNHCIMNRPHSRINGVRALVPTFIQRAEQTAA